MEIITKLEKKTKFGQGHGLICYLNNSDFLSGDYPTLQMGLENSVPRIQGPHCLFLCETANQ